MHRSARFCVLILCTLLAPATPMAAFSPEPATVQREGPAYRYPQGSWIILHIEGDPYDRGVQHGKLLWREIQQYTNCYALIQSSKSPAEG